MLNPKLIMDRLDQIRTSTNRLRHLASLKEEIYEIINEKLDDFQSFADYILKYIKKTKSF